MAVKKSSKSLDADLRVRICERELKIFKKKSLRTTGKPYQLLVREVVAAFNDGRLRIKPTHSQKNGELYDVT